MSFVIFVVMLAQVAGVAHGFVDSFHSETAHTITNIDLGNLDSTELNSDHQNCSKTCHGHSHFYLNTQTVKPIPIVKNVTLANKNYLFTSLIHTPDSPPPNIS